MDLLELLVTFADRAALVEVGEDGLVVASVADRQGAFLCRAPVKYCAITYTAGSSSRAGFSLAEHTCQLRVGRLCCAMIVGRHESRSEANSQCYAYEDKDIFHDRVVIFR